MQHQVRPLESQRRSHAFALRPHQRAAEEAIAWRRGAEEHRAFRAALLENEAELERARVVRSPRAEQEDTAGEVGEAFDGGGDDEVRVPRVFRDLRIEHAHVGPERGDRSPMQLLVLDRDQRHGARTVPCRDLGQRDRRRDHGDAQLGASSRCRSRRNVTIASAASAGVPSTILPRVRVPAAPPVIAASR